MQKLVGHFAGDGVFDPETVRIMGGAFDDAWQSLQASGATFGRDRYDPPLQELLARRIIEMARRGERNPRQLRDGALIYLAELDLGKTAPRRALALVVDSPVLGWSA